MNTMILVAMMSAVMNTGNVESAVVNADCMIRNMETRGINYADNVNREIVENWDSDEGWDDVDVIEEDGCRITIKSRWLDESMRSTL